MIVIACPSCHCRLRLPDELMGQSVRCPRCDRDFLAARAFEVRETAPAAPPPVASRPYSDERASASDDEEPPAGDVRCPYCEERVAAGSRRCRFCGGSLGEGYFGHAFRRDAEPHRGGVIQALGIASVVLGALAFVFFGLTAPLALPLGVAAWVMANRDLARMRAGEMDPDGMPATLTGRQCAVLGVVFSLLCGLGVGALFGLRALN